MFPSSPWSSTIHRRMFGLLCAGMVLVTCVPAAQGAEDVDREIRRSADRILQKLRQRNLRTVGVLPFGVQPHNQDRARYKQGQINQNLADRLQIALILANNPEDPVNVLMNVNAVAKNKLPQGQSHLDPQGRRTLMGLRYTRAWKESMRAVELKPDVLLTGIAKISPYPAETYISIRAIYANAPEKEPVEIDSIRVKTDVRTMAESGTSYVATRSFYKGVMEYAQLASGMGPEMGAHPVAPNSTAPVRLTVYYNDQAIPYQFKDGFALIPEPREHQKVCFVIEKTDPSDPRTYGVVLMVNGENTFDHQREEPIHCSKWLLKPDWPRTKILGYQIGDKGLVEPFRVLSDPESAASEVLYEPKALGMISMYVFVGADDIQAPPPNPDIPLDKEARRLALDAGAVGRAHPPDLPGDDLIDLKQSLRAEADAAGLRGLRGLIAGSGTAQGNEVRYESFRPYPKPIMVGHLRYYQPGQKLPPPPP